MSNTKHTPTPWAVWTEEKARRDDIYIVGNPTGELGGTRHLAYMVDTWARQQTAANAAFIVRAVNSHEQLVSALRDLITASDAYSTVHAPDGDDTARMVEYAAAFDNARAALAAAEA